MSPLPKHTRDKHTIAEEGSTLNQSGVRAVLGRAQTSAQGKPNRTMKFMLSHTTVPEDKWRKPVGPKKGWNLIGG